MSGWIIRNDDVWVIADKVRPDGTRIVFEIGKDRPNLEAREIDGDLALLVFSTPEWAEKYIKDARITDREPVKMDCFLTWIRELKRLFPKLTHLILEPIGGHTNVRTVSIDELLRDNQP